LSIYWLDQNTNIIPSLICIRRASFNSSSAFFLNNRFLRFDLRNTFWPTNLAGFFGHKKHELCYLRLNIRRK
jgi:hypothetical protein